MIIKLKAFIFLILISTALSAGVYQSFKDWKKDDVTSLYSVLSKENQKLSIHITKLESISEWNHETLEEDIKNIEIQRREVSEFFGFSEYHLSNFELDSSDDDFEILTINGSYKDLSGDIVYFKEINIYHSIKGTQIKLISEELDSIEKVNISEISTEIKTELKKS